MTKIILAMTRNPSMKIEMTKQAKAARADSDDDSSNIFLCLVCDN